MALPHRWRKVAVIADFSDKHEIGPKCFCLINAHSIQVGSQIGVCFLFFKVMLIYGQNYKERYNKKSPVKVSAEYSFYLLRKQQKNCHGILTRTSDPSMVSEERASTNNHISGRSICEQTPTLRNLRNDSCMKSFLRFTCFGVEKRESFLKIVYTINSCSVSHQVSFYGH